MKNSNDAIGNRTRDLPARNAVPHSTAPLSAPCLLGVKGEEIHRRTATVTLRKSMLYDTKAIKVRMGSTYSTNGGMRYRPA